MALVEDRANAFGPLPSPCCLHAHVSFSKRVRWLLMPCLLCDVQVVPGGGHLCSIKEWIQTIEMLQRNPFTIRQSLESWSDLQATQILCFHTQHKHTCQFKKLIFNNFLREAQDLAFMCNMYHCMSYIWHISKTSQAITKGILSKICVGQEKSTTMLFPNGSMVFRSGSRHLCCLLILFYPHNEIQE